MSIKRFTTSLFIAAAFALLSAPASQAAQLTLDAGLGYLNFTSDELSGEDAPSDFYAGGGGGVHFDNMWSITLETYFHTYEDDLPTVLGIQREFEFSNTFIDVTGRYNFGDPEGMFRGYVGGGLSLMNSSIDNGLADESGLGFGAKIVGGLELGSSQHMAFVEVGYRFLFSEPLGEDEIGIETSGSDFNNLPITVGYRFRMQ